MDVTAGLEQVSSPKLESGETSFYFVRILSKNSTIVLLTPVSKHPENLDHKLVGLLKKLAHAY